MNPNLAVPSPADTARRETRRQVMRDVHVADVRTTLNVDDDVLLAAKQRAAVEGTSVGEALPAMARDGMRTPKSCRSRNGVPLIPGAGKTVTPQCVQELLDESP